MKSPEKGMVMIQDPIKLLIIDDDEVDRMQLLRTIKQSGLACDISEKTHLEEAIIACHETNFDCIIIDYHLPGQDGLAGIEILHTQFPDIALIMSTGQGNEMVATEALKSGALDYIVKSNLTPELLKDSITSAMNKLIIKKQYQIKQARIEYLALHDSLTDIPNKMLFNSFLKHEIAYAKRNKKRFAVFFLDLDEFKTINDTLGHASGDLLLQQISQRFKSSLRKEDILARLGGDEFGILISHLDNIEEAKWVATRLIDGLKSPFTIDEHKINITTSIGIAVYPISGKTVAEIMRKADAAMYQAKYAGRNIFKLNC